MTTFCVGCSVHLVQSVVGQDRRDQQRHATHGRLEHGDQLPGQQHTNPILPKPVQGTPRTRGAANTRNQDTHLAHVHR